MGTEFFTDYIAKYTGDEQDIVTFFSGIVNAAKEYARNNIKEDIINSVDGEKPLVSEEVSLERVLNIYYEYLEGMEKFIREVNSEYEPNVEYPEDSENPYEVRINTAIENDIKFRENLFNGKMVDTRVENPKNVDILANIATVLTFIENTEAKEERLSLFVNDMDFNSNDLMKQCHKLFRTSIREFLKDFMVHGFAGYARFTPANVVKQESFKMF